MSANPSLEGLFLLAAALAAGGLVMGFLSGLFGIGGGGVVVPVLYELFRTMGVAEDVRLHLAIGTSLAIMVPTTLRSVTAQRAKGMLEEDVLRRLAPVVLVGVGLGILIARWAPADLFKIVWVVFAPVMALRLLLGKDSWRLGTELPRSWLIEAYGVFVGFMSTLLSVGGGAFVTMLLTLYGRPIQKAVGTASGFGPVIALPGALGFVWAGWGVAGLPPLSIGYVSLIGAALAIPTSVLAAPWGVRVAHRLPRRSLEVAFAIFLLLVGFRFLISLMG
jgi:uncharacterized membrane protein YfcA